MPWHNDLVRSMLRDAVRSRAETYFSGRLVDIGCGNKPFEPVLSDLVSEHIGVDHDGTLHEISRAEIVATAYSIPVADGTFDCALMTEVLEHLEEPEAALRECLRILRPDATLIVTVPFIWHIHEQPRDFFRYTNFGLSHLLDAAGFEIVRIDSLGGFWTTFGQLLLYNAAFLGRGFFRRSRLGPLIGRVILAVAIALERRIPRPAWASHFVAVARVPVPSEPKIPVA